MTILNKNHIRQLRGNVGITQVGCNYGLINKRQPAKNSTINGIALLISLYFPPEIGGGSTGAWNRAMVLHKMGYSVFVVCGFPTYPSGKVSDGKYRGKLFSIEISEPFTLLRLRLLPISYSGFTKRLILFLNFVFLCILYLFRILKITGKVDLVYARAPFPFSSIAGFVYSKITRSFFVFEAPDLWPEQLVILETHLLPIIMRIGRVVAKWSYSVPDVIITVGELAANHISREYEPKAPVYGIPIGVDPDRFPRISTHDSRTKLIKMCIIPSDLQDKFIVLYSGIISNNQRVENLAYAARKLKKDDEKEIAILIIGEGDEKRKLQELKLIHNLNGLYILPPQPREIMPVLISAADLCAILLSFESIFDAALPTKFYEYLACGKPMIGVCRGELADIINSSEIGRTADPGNVDKVVSIIKFLKNSPDLMQTLETNCYITLQRFSLDAISNQFLDLLNKYRGTKS